MPPIDLAKLKTFSRRLVEQAQPGDLGKPNPNTRLLHRSLVPVGDHGQLQLLEPDDGLPVPAPPGRWTRFKAALVGLPLIGGLDTIRRAREAVDAVPKAARRYEKLRREAGEFRDQFAQRLKRDFPETGDEALRSIRRAPGLTPYGVETVLNEPERLQEKYWRDHVKAAKDENHPSIRNMNEEWRLIGQAYAGAKAAKMQRSYLTQPIADVELTQVREGAETQIRLLVSEAPGLLESLKSAAADYTAKIEAAPLQQRRDIACQFAGYIEWITRVAAFCPYDKELRQVPSGGQRPGNEEFVAHPQDVQLVYRLCARPDEPYRQRFEEEIESAWQQFRELRVELAADIQTLTGDPDFTVEQAGRLLRGLQHETTPATPTELRHDALRSFIRDCLAADPLLKESHVKGQPVTNPRLERRWRRIVDRAVCEVMAEFAQELPQAGTPLPGQFRATVLAKLVVKARSRVRELAEQREQAWQQLREPGALSEERIRLLEEGLSQIDPSLEWLDAAHLRTQANEYARIADVIAEGLPKLDRASQLEDPVAIFDVMEEIERALRSGLQALNESVADVPSLASTFENEVVRERVFQLCARLARAERFPAPDSNEASGSGKGKQAVEEPAVKPIEAPGKKPAPGHGKAGMQFEVLAAARAPGLVGRYRELVGVNHCDAYAEAYADAYAEAYAAAAASPSPREARAKAEAQVEGQKLPQWNHTPPRLLARALLDPARSRDRFNARGVVEGSLAESCLCDSFSLENLAMASTTPPLEDHRSVQDMLQDTLASADIIIDGRRLTLHPRRSPGQVVQDIGQVSEAFQKALGSEDQRLPLAIARLLSSRRLETFCAAVDRTAFDPPLPMAHQHSDHEILKNADGSWTVRSIHAAYPQSQGRTEQVKRGSSPRLTAPIPLPTDGVVLYELTHKVGPPARDGAVHFVPSGHRVVFDF